MGKRKVTTVTQSLSSMVADAWSVIEGLGEECREVCDNMPESLQQTSRYEALDASASAIEGLSEPDVDDCLEDVQVTYTPAKLKPRAGRAARCEAAVAQLEAAKDAVESYGSDQDEKGNNSTAEAAESLANDLDTIIGEAQNLEFPGMFG
jgi:hypothetical protein